MVFDEVKFRAFLWDIYGHQFWGVKSVGCPEIISEFDVIPFDQWIEKNLTMFQMVGHLCEFLAEIDEI